MNTVGKTVTLNTSDELQGERAIIEKINDDGSIVVKVTSYGELAIVQPQEIQGYVAAATKPVCHYCGCPTNGKLDFFGAPVCNDCR